MTRQVTHIDSTKSVLGDSIDLISLRIIEIIRINRTIRSCLVVIHSHYECHFTGTVVVQYDIVLATQTT